MGTTSFTLAWTLGFCIAAVFIRQHGAEYDSCFDDANKVSLPCNPPAYDVMWSNVASIRVEPAQATCGTTGPSTYRRLAPRMTNTFQTCDASIPGSEHPPVYMIDDNTTSTWWQSINLLSGTTELNINITVSFNTTFRMDSDLLITFNSGRPDKMVLWKSTDYGSTWTTLQYYSRDCTDFQSVLVPGAAITLETPTAVICTEEYAEQQVRAVAGQTVKLVNQDRFDLYLGPIGINVSNFYNSLEETLLDFLTFTDIRIQLIAPLQSDKGTYDAYYYAISDIQVVARCFCNLHALDCNYTSSGITCECQHNTMGKNCELCQPLYNERPWKKGSYAPYPKGQANECLKCECNDHALSCTYNATYGRGVCDTCLHNTSGYHCEMCALTYYPNVTVTLNDTNRCIACNCEPLGVQDNNLVCAQTDTGSVSIGQCPCKALVTSRRCDTCVSGYYGLITGPTPGTCTPCYCSQDGTVGQSTNCTQDTGQCTCKLTTMGRACDSCRDGFYSFPTGNPQRECYPCDCDKGGAMSPICDKMTGACTCRTNITGDKCTLPAPGFYVPALDATMYQPVKGTTCEVTSGLYTDQAPFDGTKFAVCDLSSGTVTLELDGVAGGQMQKDILWPYVPALRYSTNSSSFSGTVTLTPIGNTAADLTPLRIRLGKTIDPICPSTGQIGLVDLNIVSGRSMAAVSQEKSFTLDARCKYTLTLQLSKSAQSSNNSAVEAESGSITIDSLILLPTLGAPDGATSFEIYASAENKTQTAETYTSCMQQLASLRTRQITLTTSPCKELLFSVGAELFNGSISCDCLNISSQASPCQALGGQCSCKSAVSGRTCDICTPGYFNFTESGCSPCNCHPKGAVNGACDINGRCTCKANIITPQDNVIAVLDNGTAVAVDGTCSRCLPNYYGIDKGVGCSPCNCNALGSTSLQCNETGQCPCKDIVMGLKCDACKDGYYGFGPNGCSPCNCSTSGSTRATCDQLSGVCTCKANAQGAKCTLCKYGFFNLAASNPDGCQPCFCYSHSRNCTSAVGFHYKVVQVANLSTPGDFAMLLGDRHWSYGQLLSVNFEAVGNVDVSNEVLISLAGLGKTLHYVAPSGTVFSSNGTLKVVIHLLEQNWIMDGNQSTTTAEDMLGVLANLTTVSTIGMSKGQSVSTVYVGLDWAEYTGGASSSEVSYVENCDCAQTTTHTAGLSCQSCSRGYMREDLTNISPYGQCIACNCSQRGITNPPECSEVTGQCQNCRNGTIGDHCELCAPHVLGTECDRCESSYWGLEADGCRECNCSIPGSLSSICNTTTGQCICAVNVGGRTCDQCQENFYNLTHDGCLECDACYSLLKIAIMPLRQLESDTSSNISAIQSNNMTSMNGSFMIRFQEAFWQTKQLTDFLTSVQQSESQIKASMLQLNATLQSLETEMDMLQHNTTVDIDGLIAVSESAVTTAMNYKTIMENNTIDVYNKLAMLQVNHSTLSNLASSLKGVEQYLISLANASSVDQQILNSLSTLNSTLFLANQLVTEAQQKSEAANKIHSNNTSNLLALETRIAALFTAATKSLTNVQLLATNDVLSTADKLRTALNQPGSFRLDNTNLGSSLAQAKVQTGSLQSQLAAELALFNTSNVNALATVSRTDDLINQTQTLGFYAADWRSRANAAQQRVAFLQSTATGMLQEASKTLSTLNNFTVKVQDVEQQVNSLNRTITPALTLSAQLIQQSQNLSQTLALLQQTASSAKTYSQQALDVITARQREFQAFITESNQLQTRLNNTANLSEDRFRAIVITSVNVVQAAEGQCSAMNDSVTNFQVQMSSAQQAVESSFIQVSNLTQRANGILGQLHSLNKIDSASVVAVFTNVQLAQNALNVDDNRLLLNNLQIKKEVQRKQIDDLKLLRDNLKIKIQSLKAFQDQINKI